MVNPVKLAKTAWADAHESVEAYRTGRWFRGVVLMGETALDLLPFVPVGGLAANGVKLGARGVSAVGSRLGFFGGRGVVAEVGVSNSAHFIDPVEVGFSQTTVSRVKTRTDPITGKMISYSFDDIVSGMRANGWQGEPLNVIRMPDGTLTSIDNTRLLAARQAGIKAHIKVHDYDVPIPFKYAREYTARGRAEPSTWGDAIHSRISIQSGKYFQDRIFSEKFRDGSIYDPELTGRGPKW
jgi:filamentous hemagglutinin